MSEYRYVVSGRGIPLGIFNSYADATDSLFMSVGVDNASSLYGAGPGSGFWEFTLMYKGTETHFTITAVKPSTGPGDLFA